MDENVILRVNDENVEMNNFVRKIVVDVNKAIVENLKIDEKGIKTREIKITL